MSCVDANGEPRDDQWSQQVGCEISVKQKQKKAEKAEKAKRGWCCLI
jgi:hypothetical protein